MHEIRKCGSQEKDGSGELTLPKQELPTATEIGQEILATLKEAIGAQDNSKWHVLNRFTASSGFSSEDQISAHLVKSKQDLLKVLATDEVQEKIKFIFRLNEVCRAAVEYDLVAESKGAFDTLSEATFNLVDMLNEGLSRESEGARGLELHFNTNNSQTSAASLTITYQRLKKS